MTQDYSNPVKDGYIIGLQIIEYIGKQIIEQLDETHDSGIIMSIKNSLDNITSNRIISNVGTANFKLGYDSVKPETNKKIEETIKLLGSFGIKKIETEKGIRLEYNSILPENFSKEYEILVDDVNKVLDECHEAINYKETDSIEKDEAYRSLDKKLNETKDELLEIQKTNISLQESAFSTKDLDTKITELTKELEEIKKNDSMIEESCKTRLDEQKTAYKKTIEQKRVTHTEEVSDLTDKLESLAKKYEILEQTQNSRANQTNDGNDDLSTDITPYEGDFGGAIETMGDILKSNTLDGLAKTKDELEQVIFDQKRLNITLLTTQKERDSTLLEVTVLKSENTSLVSEVEGYKKDISIRDEELEKYKMVASMASQRIDEQQGSINRLNEKNYENQEIITTNLLNYSDLELLYKKTINERDELIQTNANLREKAHIIKLEKGRLLKEREKLSLNLSNMISKVNDTQIAYNNVEKSNKKKEKTNKQLIKDLHETKKEYVVLEQNIKNADKTIKRLSEEKRDINNKLGQSEKRIILLEDIADNREEKLGEISNNFSILQKVISDSLTNKKQILIENKDDKSK